MGSSGESIEDLKINLLKKMHDEIQKMKIDMMEQFINLGETINRVKEIVRKMNASGGRAYGGTAPQPDTQIMKVATDTRVREESRQHVTSSLKRSATSPREHSQARPVSISRQHHTARANKPGRCSQSISFKNGYGFSYVQLPTLRAVQDEPFPCKPPP
ncbi:hypothetical protein Bca101_082573 [Brassica carinata]